MSLTKVTLNILIWIIYPLDLETSVQNIPDECVPSLDRNQTMDDHNSYLQKLGFPQVPTSFPHPTRHMDRIKDARSLA